HFDNAFENPALDYLRICVVLTRRVSMPTYMHPTIRVGEYANLTPEQTLQKIINWIAPCPPFNATGQPAIALPAGFDPHGLPVGVQLVGKPADELTLISLAAQLEAARLGFDHRPPLAV
ncbi:amidase family protein, partial [Lyngbya sp. CCY1209]|uniref:amidase family protein n=1 Tax=Lyngbya sp. CCY1209 TaxID=2886103 RepID=UPI002D202D73